MIRPQNSQPIFNIPNVILVMAILFLGVHLFRVFFLAGSESDLTFLLYFAFIPARYDLMPNGTLETLANFWTPISYSFLHADWTHLIVNTIWLVAFGSVVARRLGVIRFLILCIVGSLGGAFAHYITNIGSAIPTIGASAIVSACMGSAVRFALHGTGLSFETPNRLPALSLIETLTHRTTFTFIAIWMLINFFSGTGALNFASGGSDIAWEAHVGGFVAGLLVFPLLDPVKNIRA